MASKLKARSRLGKYRLTRRLSEGGFAEVFEAVDTIEGVKVALKVPRQDHVTKDALNLFKREARVQAKLEHPNILGVKNAEIIDGTFVIAMPLGESSLTDRMSKRMSLERRFEFAEQMIAAVAHAHAHNVIHCDIKPDNFILFHGPRLKLTDFGIARVAFRTMIGSGSGTLGYMSPEQAMGRNSFRADVFSLGLILHELFSGHLPKWPFDWPQPGHEKIKASVHPDFLEMLRRSLQVDPRKRYADATQMEAAFQRLRPRIVRRMKGLERTAAKKVTQRRRTDWRMIRFRQCHREFGKELKLDYDCIACHGPVSAAMKNCPWCQRVLAIEVEEPGYPAHCPRCRKGRKADWSYCAWCHGPGFEVVSSRSYGDARYRGKCTGCSGQLMPFSRYCPWCRLKVKQSWRITSSKATCRRCGWGVLPEYWSNCPWCGTGLSTGARRT
ncbi:MAG: protein kinase [Planctomycetes bacterium]|nr:protein kinase [Planctomycetota bacterium]